MDKLMDYDDLRCEILGAMQNCIALQGWLVRFAREAPHDPAEMLDIQISAENLMDKINKLASVYRTLQRTYKCQDQ